ncbi:hypothetical protein LCGC14_2230440 [marine sediment metagenome]|uniref:Uncharacterized protein n=1 Tax=marine sediment metagenome TaxID=412755 RepID=A0A0F9DW37_9ZZZZ
MINILTYEQDGNLENSISLLETLQRKLRRDTGATPIGYEDLTDAIDLLNLFYLKLDKI